MHEQDVRPDGVSVSEAARILRVSPGTVRRRIAEGTLKAERVIRPQGTAWRVHVPDDAPATHNVLPAGTSNGASDSESGHAPVTYAPHAQDVPATAGLVESVARLIAELAEVRVVSDRRADRVAELERENARLTAQLAVERTVRREQAIIESPVAGQEMPQPVESTADTRMARLRALASWVPMLIMLALAAVTLLLALVVLALTP
jgi:excisionase family DNA binding protein